jgi:hypothetical protein
MDEEAIYNFDTSGWVLLRGVLSSSEVAAALSAGRTPGDVDSPALLAEHPALAAAAGALIGPQHGRGTTSTYKLDVPPALLSRPSSAALSGGRFDAAGQEVRSRSYRVEAGHRRCHGLRVVWALSDAGPADGAVAVIGGSHRSGLPAPPDVRSGADTMGLLRRVATSPGGGTVMLAENDSNDSRMTV